MENTRGKGSKRPRINIFGLKTMPTYIKDKCKVNKPMVPLRQQRTVREIVQDMRRVREELRVLKKELKAHDEYNKHHHNEYAE